MKKLSIDLNSNSPFIPTMSGVYEIHFEDLKLHVNLRIGSIKVMIINFHGAYDRASLAARVGDGPKFQRHFKSARKAFQLSIADPTLSLHPKMKAGWYLGGGTLALQEKLPILILKLSNLLKIERRIFVGGSSGGFAALFYSWFDPGSICITVNPQIDLTSYRLKIGYPIDDWKRKAFTAKRIEEDSHNHIVLNLNELYSQGFDNLVIYIQSVTDIRHYRTQLASIAPHLFARPNRFILNSGYWGTSGHRNSVPFDFIEAWVKATVISPEIDAQSLFELQYLYLSTDMKGDSMKIDKEIDRKKKDEILARSLLNFSLDR